MRAAVRPSKNPIRGFSDGASALRARFDGTPSNRTLARIGEFFASGNPRQKSYFKSRIRGKIDFFDKLTAALNASRRFYCLIYIPCSSI